MRRSHLFLALFVPGLCFFLQEGFAQPPEFKVTAGDGAALDNFGNSVSISGDYAVVGAWFDDDKGSASGSAYFFHRIGSTWVQEAKVTAVDGAANDRFGKSVSISGDYAIIGAEGDDDTFPNEGAAYIFHRFGANWIQEEKLTATDGAGSDVFGSSVSISGDYAIVGAWAADTPALGGTGAAYIFRRTGTTSWTEEAKLISVDGFGVPDQGPADAFGFSVSISGDAAIVGVTGDDDQGFNSGSAFIFRRNGTTWDREAKLSAGPDAGFFDQFGYSVSISGDQAIVGAHDNLGGPDPAGSAYIFGFDGANWPREVRLTGDGAPDDGFGQSVGMTLNRAIVGAFRDENPGDVGEDFGSAYIYKFVSSWVQEYKVTASDREPDDEFGISVAIGNRDAIVGAHLDDDKGSRSGSAYFYNVNLSPVAAVAPPFTFECAGPTGTAVTLDGTGSFDPDGDPFTFFWSAPGITFDDPTSQTPTGTFPLGTTTVTLTLTDVFGLGSTNTFDLTVEDTIPPVFTSVPADVTVECSAQGGQTVDLGGLATATDICDPSPTITNDAPGLFTLGTTVVTWTATDSSGNSSTVTQNVEVEDTTSPVVVGPADVTVECSTQGGQAVNIGTATATDICDPSPTITNDAPGLFTLGITVVTWTATDVSGNSATATQNVEVEDTTSPDLTVPADVIASCGEPVNIGTATATDICDPNPTVTNDAPPSFPFGTTIVTWTAADVSGNSATATQNVTVEDDITPPVFTFVPADVTVECSAQGGQSVNIGGPATATDACDPSPTITNDAPALFQLGTTVVTWTAADAAGNSATATQNVEVEDTTSPGLTPPADVIASCGEPVDIGTATATDICDPNPSVTNDAPPSFPFGTTIVTWTATDATGNSVTATQNVMVEDDITPPVFTFIPADVTVECSAQGGQSVNIGGPATATDACDPSPTIINDAPALFLLGTTVVTWTATDSGGNSSTATQNVTVEDTTPPVLVPPPDVAVECVAQGGQPVDIGTATATDICDPAPTIMTDAPAQFPLGTTIVTWTATDASGNTAFATQNVTVEDDATPPVLTIPSDITVECSSQDGQAVEIGTATATDICDPSPTVTNDAPELFLLGMTIVTWTATDASGNAASAEQLVIVVDTIPPEIRAALVSAKHAHHHGMDDLYHDDDDDDNGDKHAGKNVFCVLMEGADPV